MKFQAEAGQYCNFFFNQKGLKIDIEEYDNTSV